MEAKDSAELKKAIREWRGQNFRGEGGRWNAQQLEYALRTGYELGWRARAAIAKATVKA